MDRNTIIGFVLIFILVIAYSIYNRNVLEEEQVRQRYIEDSLAQIEQQRIEDSIRTLPREKAPFPASEPSVAEVESDSIIKAKQFSKFGPFSEAASGTEEEYVLQNEEIKVTFTNLGGKVSNVIVKGYDTFRGDSIELFNSGANEFSVGIPLGTNFITTDSLYFEVAEKSANSITFRAPAGEGRYIEQQYALDAGSNWVNYNLNLVGLDELISSRETKIVLDWETELKLQERELGKEREYTTIYYKLFDDDEVDYISEGDNVSEEALKYNLKWVSFKQQFFNATLVAENEKGFSSAVVWTQASEEDTAFLKYLRAKVYLPYTASGSESYPMKFYFGPNGYNNLKKYDLAMEDMVPMGGFPLKQVNRFIILPVFNFFERFTSNYGLIILLLAIFIKLILTPLTYRSYISSAKMRVLKPELDEIREKYKDDMQKQQMEQMKLYRKTGVSMFGGCIPLLLQFPILFAMYRFFPASIHLRGAEFLWAEDLSTYDSILDLPFNIPFYGDHVSLFTLLMAATSVLYAKMNSQLTPGGGGGAMAGQMKMLQYIMPFFLIFIFNSFSAGLTYYYLLYNILSFGQQYISQKFFIDEDKIRQKLEERKKKPVKQSKWQKRLEEMQKMQQKKLSEKQKGKGKKK